MLLHRESGASVLRAPRHAGRNAMTGVAFSGRDGDRVLLPLSRIVLVRHA